MTRPATRTLILRTLLVVALTALAAFASWLIPRATRPPEPFGVAMELIDDGRGDEAVYLLEDGKWVGVAEYRAGRYQRALGAWIVEEGVENFYNIGNAYARLSEWQAAKAAYREALNLDPGHADAKFNLALVEKAEEAERKLAEDSRVTREMGRWEEGSRDDKRSGDEPGSEVVEGGAKEGSTRAADQPTAQAGRSDNQGMLGDKPKSEEMMSGASGGEADERATDGMEAGEGRALILRESTQAAEVLLRRIRDDADRVLRARLKAAQKMREEAEAK